MAFEAEINRYFSRAGIGWKLVFGHLEMRGGEAFEQAIVGAQKLLRDEGKTTTASELHEAILDLSRRPDPEVTGAIQHAMAALECVARDVTGRPTRSERWFVEILASFPGRLILLWNKLGDGLQTLVDIFRKDRPRALKRQKCSWVSPASCAGT